jgi:hypothetical protein
MVVLRLASNCFSWMAPLSLLTAILHEGYRQSRQYADPLRPSRVASRHPRFCKEAIEDWRIHPEQSDIMRSPMKISMH